MTLKNLIVDISVRLDRVTPYSEDKDRNLRELRDLVTYFGSFADSQRNEQVAVLIPTSAKEGKVVVARHILEDDYEGINVQRIRELVIDDGPSDGFFNIYLSWYGQERIERDIKVWEGLRRKIDSSELIPYSSEDPRDREIVLEVRRLPLERLVEFRRLPIIGIELYGPEVNNNTARMQAKLIQKNRSGPVDVYIESPLSDVDDKWLNIQEAMLYEADLFLESH